MQGGEICKKSMNAWSAAADESFEEMFSHLSACGFAAVELNVDEPGHSAHSLTMETSEAELFKIRETAAQFGLKIASVSTSPFYNGTLGAKDAAEREKGKNISKKTDDLCRRAGN